MKTFLIRIVGTSPLLHHRMTDEALYALLGTRGVKKKDKEIKTPREIAASHAYGCEKNGFKIPMDYITGAFKHVASDYKQKNSQRKSYKAIAGGVFCPTDEFALLEDRNRKTIKKFEVDIRKATNHLKGAIAVCRPRFDRWECEFTVQLDTDLISPEVANQILQDAGRRAGIGSYRVAKSGPFGRFDVVKFLPLE